MTMIPSATESLARLRDLAPKLARCQAETDAAFAAVAAFLDETRPGVTVHTADLAYPGSPWSLAYRRFMGRHRLVIQGHAFPEAEPVYWEHAEPEARLATLGQLPDLLARIGTAAEVLARLADSTREVVRRVEMALANARGKGA